MKASKFSDAQKAFILKQGADGVPVADICRRAGISQATYFNRKKKYEGARPARDEAAEAAGGREYEASGSSLPTSRWTGRCCRISSAEKSEAWSSSASSSA